MMTSRSPVVRTAAGRALALSVVSEAQLVERVIGIDRDALTKHRRSRRTFSVGADHDMVRAEGENGQRTTTPRGSVRRSRRGMMFAADKLQDPGPERSSRIWGTCSRWPGW